MERQAIYSNSWYPSDPEILATITHIDKSKGHAKFAVIPHAGLFYSAEGIRKAFNNLDQSIEKMILIAPSHYYYLPVDTVISYPYKSYQTPLGSIKGFNLKIFKEGKEKYFQKEHALEMATPFIKNFNNIHLAIVLLNMFSSYQTILESAQNLLSTINEKTALLASSDFTHYGKNFNYTPFGLPVNETVMKQTINKDLSVAQMLIQGKIQELFEINKKEPSTICGLAGIMLIAEIAKQKKTIGKIIYHSNSNIIQKKISQSFVDYITIIWE